MQMNASTTPRLKAMELQGYKTFASKSRFEFAPTVTTIVGPNGSGKSNISDAIRWVLGEQSYSLLRGKKTEDMIFSGSESRAQASMAAATIIFDNEDGWMPIDFSEVSISRRAYRDGVNEYLLNGQRVRLRDVSDLLAQCGLGQRTYTIIGQGLVDAALSLKAEERRRLFEEAAGIGLYRSRKEQSLRRLETTRRNLERVQDILAELKPRLRSLERQAKRAREHAQLRDDLNAVLRTWYGYHWYQLKDRVGFIRQEAASLRAQRDELAGKQAAADRDLTAVRSTIGSLRTQLHEWSQAMSDLFRQREQLGRKFAVAQERNRWLTERLQSLEDAIAAEHARIEADQKRLESLREHIAQSKASIQEAEQAIRQLDEGGEHGATDREGLLRRADALRKQLDVLTGERARWHAKQEQKAERVQELQFRRDATKEELNALRGQIDQAQADVRALDAALQHAKQNENEIRTRRDDLRRQQEEGRMEQQGLQEELVQLQTASTGLEAKLEIARLSLGASDAMVHLLGEARSGRLEGLVGRIADRIQVQRGHQKAITAALGDFGTALTFRSSADIGAAMLRLERDDKGGRTALIPLETLQGAEQLDALQDTDCLGNAASLVEAPPAFRAVIELLLGHTLIVRDRAAARRMLPLVPAQARLVTLDGDVFTPAGLVLLDAGEDAEHTLLSARDLEAKQAQTNQELALTQSHLEKRRAANEEIYIALQQMEKDLESGRHAVQMAAIQRGQAEHALAQLELQKERLERQLQAQDAAIEAEKAKTQELQKEGDGLNAEHQALEERIAKTIAAAENAQVSRARVQAEAQVEVAHNTLMEAERQVRDIEARLASGRTEIASKGDQLRGARLEREETEKVSAEAEQGMQEIEKDLDALNTRINATERKLREAEQQRSILETQESRARLDLQSAERADSQAQIELARFQEEISSLRHRIEDDFGLVAFEVENGVVAQEPLPFEGLVERLPRVDELPEEVEGQVQSLRAQLRRMGAVNPEANQEFEEVNRRVEFLTEQVADLRHAETRIQEVISELDLLMEREFRKTFDAVAVEFRNAFTRLFGGGAARLALTEGADLSRTGIDIEARLPGRREQGLAMLSGGERSLTACALIFSLLKVSPTPFCVLDEVDAMLDEANVMRFREMLQELSQETQFIVITHNRQTVQAAEIVYGISMGGDSASQVISLKLDEAEKALVD